jgi:hypothetical protein
MKIGVYFTFLQKKTSVTSFMSTSHVFSLIIFSFLKDWAIFNFHKKMQLQDGDVLFELSLLLPNARGSSKMQGMDRKNNGHAWCKVITINIKNSFGLNFKNTHCLGHLHYVQDDCENFVHFAFCNETLWCNENVHILVVG